MDSINLILRPVLISTVLLATACASLSQTSSQDSALLEQQQTQVNPPSLQQDTVADASYNLMVAEIALNQGNTEVAIRHYLDVALAQDNPEIAERAVRVAVYGQDLEAAVVAAQRWIELDPNRVEARQVIAAIYIRQDKIQEAFVYIDELIQTSDLDDAELFPPLLGILAREKNANTVLAVTLLIAQKNPDRAYAQYLHGMLSAQNGRAEAALEYLDRSLALEEIEGVHATRAKILLSLGRSEKPLSACTRRLKTIPMTRLYD